MHSSAENGSLILLGQEGTVHGASLLHTSQMVTVVRTSELQQLETLEQPNIYPALSQLHEKDGAHS